MHKRKKLTFTDSILYGDKFYDSDFSLKVKVGVLNVFIPLIGSIVFPLIYYVYVNDLKPDYQSAIDVFFISCITLSYLHFKFSDNIDFYVHAISIVLVIYVPYVFYSGGIEQSGALWIFLIPILLFFLNDIVMHSIIYNLIFVFILVMLMVFFMDGLLKVYSYHFLIRCYLSFFIYLLFTISFQVVKTKLSVNNDSQKLELETNNIALKKSLQLQKKIFLELSDKEKFQKETTRNLKSIINNTDDLIWLIDTNYQVQLFNNSFRNLIKDLFGIDAEREDVFEELNRNQNSTLVATWRLRYEAVFKTGKKMSFVDKNSDNGVENSYAISDFYPIITDGKIVGITCFSRDITAQRKIKREKEELARLNSTIIASLGEIVYDYDVVKDEFTWNDAIYQVLGYNYTQMGNKSKDFLNKVHIDDVELLTKEIEDLKETGFNTPLDIRVLTKQDKYLWIQNRVNVLYNDAGVPVRLIGVLFNINDRKQAEINQLQAVVKGVDVERKRIAGEIHDGLGQTLIAASLILNSLEEVFRSSGSGSEQERFFTIMNLVNDAIDEGREIAHSIMPKSLEDYGLIPAIKSLVNKIKLSKSFDINFHCNIDDEVRFPNDVENSLYRIAQEALNNIIKHSEAGSVILQLVVHERSIIFTIEDDGVGFVNGEGNTDVGLGLQNIKNRISSIGGNLQIDTHAGYGTLLTIEVDLKETI